LCPCGSILSGWNVIAAEMEDIVDFVMGGEALVHGPAGSYFPFRPFKHNAARRHRIPRARYRVTNWPADEAGRRRGDLTL
jgi:hypothetical protein